MPTTTELRVRYAETDKMGVVYYANYLVWCEVARTDFIRQHGGSYAEWEEQGVGLAVSEANVRYHSSARYDDLVRIETWLTAVRSRGVTFEYRMTHAESGERIASAFTTLIAIAPTGRPITLPPDVRERLTQAIDAPPAR